jgi:protein-disulfide isomerase
MVKESLIARALALLLVLFPAATLAADAQDASLTRDRLVQARMGTLLNGPATLVLGNPEGNVTIIEFFDYTCPFCKAAEPRIQQLLSTDKNVRLVVKEFPILEPVSLFASKAALASARQGKYAAFHQKMMEFRGQLNEELVFGMAKEAGIDTARLKTDMQATEIADAVIANFNLARALRIFDTPTFIIGNHVVTEPSSTLDFAKAVAAARGK